MNSAYTYRGYTIDVRCEFRLDQPRDHAPPPDTLRFGFVAVVQVRATGSAPRLLAPVRLGDDGGHLFDDSVDALRAGRAAGEIIVDDLLVDAGAADGRAHS
ncbi:hydrogenase maturation factor [Burkholderia sp. Bp9143]|uniref:hydrogenase maturation factor n=1 Tax=Burkholderia sp. Bp9143 TaxID=2184574 RepID=UPI000F5ADFC5|nr:hydrogenase maturation factor [Burkholderia sp. Bp9143]RQR40350.1 hydrogenase maturation factor [Burkholderia sp. Bp9143]